MDITFKTKKMVENGQVLDDRGSWIPLIDKLQMERFFIDHLAMGEVLRNKRWVTIDEAKAIDKSVKTQSVQEVVKSEVATINPPSHVTDHRIPEVNVQSHIVREASIQLQDDEFSFNNFLNENDPVVEPEMEETNHSDITHEHCSMMIKEGEEAGIAQITADEVPKKEESAKGEEKLHNSPDVAVRAPEQIEKAPSVESFFVNNFEHETVVLVSGKIEDLEKVDDSLIAATMARATSKVPVVKYKENIDEIIESIEEFDEWEKDARKRQALFFAVASGVAAIIGSSAIILLILI